MMKLYPITFTVEFRHPHTAREIKHLTGAVEGAIGAELDMGFVDSHQNGDQEMIHPIKVTVHDFIVE